MSEQEHARTQQAILELGRRWAAAERAGDAAALDAVLAPTFVGVGPWGFVLTREQWLARYAPGGLRNQTFTWEEVQVRDYGDSAIAVGVQAQEATYQGQDASGRFRATQVAVRDGGHWLVAGMHLSPLGIPPPR